MQLPARLKPVVWPHFMDKKENDKRVYYKSSSVLGQIYDLADISTDNLGYSHQGTSAAPCVMQSFVDSYLQWGLCCLSALFMTDQLSSACFVLNVFIVYMSLDLRCCVTKSSPCCDSLASRATTTTWEIVWCPVCYINHGLGHFVTQWSTVVDVFQKQWTMTQNLSMKGLTSM